MQSYAFSTAKTFKLYWAKQKSDQMQIGLTHWGFRYPHIFRISDGIQYRRNDSWATESISIFIRMNLSLRIATLELF